MSADMHCFRLDYRITNTSKDEVVVKVKGGLSYLIRGSKEPSFQNEQMLYVSINGIYLDNIMIDETQALTKLDRRILIELGKELQRLRDNNPHYYSTLTNNLQIAIKLTEGLVETHNAICSELLGITLYLGIQNRDQPCLNSPGHTFREMFEHLREESGENGGLHYFIYVNDPNRVAPVYWTNCLGRSFEVPRLNNDLKKPGLYIGLSRGIEPRETLYYTFDQLDTKLLEGAGIFESKAACDKGGNTERYLAVESRNKDLVKEVRELKTQLDSVSESLEKADTSNGILRAELEKVKYDHKQELSSIKLQHQVSSDISKAENRIQGVVSKANFDLVKHKASQNTWGDFAKAVGTLAGVAFTGYKLFTS